MNKLILPIAISAALLQGCGSDSASTSSFSLDITDAPIDGASAVNIAFDGIQVIGAEGTFEFDLDETQSINLLELQGSTSMSLLNDVELPAGEYEQIRLMIDGSASITINGAEFPITVPSGDQTGYKLVSGFTLPANGSASFTIDFDVRKSVVSTNLQSAFMLKPTLRLVDNAEVGHISGSIAGELLTECSSAAVYAYEGSDVTPAEEGDAEGATVVASSLIDSTDNSYEIGFLVAGDYTVALTCEANLDTAEAVEDISFVSSHNVTVSVDGTVSSDFNLTLQ